MDEVTMEADHAVIGRIGSKVTRVGSPGLNITWLQTGKLKLRRLVDAS